MSRIYETWITVNKRKPFCYFLENLKIDDTVSFERNGGYYKCVIDLSNYDDINYSRIRRILTANQTNFL